MSTRFHQMKDSTLVSAKKRQVHSKSSESPRTVKRSIKSRAHLQTWSGSSRESSPERTPVQTESLSKQLHKHSKRQETTASVSKGEINGASKDRYFYPGSTEDLQVLCLTIHSCTVQELTLMQCINKVSSLLIN